MYSISDIQEVLQMYHLAPQRRLGQNFLIHQITLHRIRALVEANPKKDTIWEIGAGLGAISSVLLPYARSLYLFEVDHGCASYLRSVYRTACVKEGDFFNTSTTALKEGRPSLIIGSLPYYSAAAMLKHIIVTGIGTERMIFVVQDEFANRIAAKHNQKLYGVISILVQQHYAVTKQFVVPASAFYPVPHVQSCVIVLSALANRPSMECTVKVLHTARMAFRQRRKILKNALPHMTECMERCGINMSLRPENLSPSDYCRLAQCAVLDDVILRQ